MVGTIVIQLNLHVWLSQLTGSWQLELHVFYRYTAFYPHRLIIGAYGQDILRHLIQIAYGGWRVEVSGLEQQRQLIAFHDV